MKEHRKDRDDAAPIPGPGRKATLHENEENKHSAYNRPCAVGKKTGRVKEPLRFGAWKVRVLPKPFEFRQ